MRQQPIIRAFFDEPTNTVSYIVADPATKQAAVIDPVLDYDPNASQVDTRSVEAILSVAKEQGYRIVWTLETHAHADHLSGSPYIKAKTGAKIGIGEHIKDVQRIFRPIFDAADLKTDGSDFDHLFKDGERFKIGELDAEVLYTPGHTPADVTYKVEDAAFVGDTLFMPDYGTARADFPGGDAHRLYQSISKITGAAGEHAAVHVPRLQGAGPRHFRVGNYGRRRTREQCARQGRRQRRSVRCFAYCAGCDAFGTAAPVAVHPGQHPRREIPARSRQRCALSHHTGEIQEHRRACRVKGIIVSLRINDAKELTAKAAEATRLLTALANESRLAILCQLVEGERSVGELVEAVGLSQSALSQHLAKLRTAGIVATRRDAQTIYYRLASKAAGSVMTTLAEIYCRRRPRKSVH